MTNTICRSTPDGPPRGGIGVLQALTTALTVAVCGLAVMISSVAMTRPATAKHCLTCEDKDAPVDGGIPANTGTAG